MGGAGNRATVLIGETIGIERNFLIPPPHLLQKTKTPVSLLQVLMVCIVAPKNTEVENSQSTLLN